MIINPSDLFPKVLQNTLDKYGQDIELDLGFLPSLNKRIHGLCKKNLVVVGGRPSQGKSTLLLNMASSIATQGKRVLFFTLEMTVKTCILRLMNAYCSIDNWVNIAGMSPEEYNVCQGKITEFRDHLENLELVFLESRGKTFEEINKIIERVDGGVDAVFIDYVQMIANNDKSGIDEYIKALRNLAIKKDFCAIIGSQINRGTYDSSKVTYPEMWQLKSSGALEEICDLCVLVHWQHHYTREEENYNDYWIRVCKNREGRTGVFDCRFEPEFCRICEKPDETFKEKYTVDQGTSIIDYGRD